MKIRIATQNDVEKIGILLYELIVLERKIMKIHPPQKNEVISRISFDFVYKSDLEYFICEKDGEIIGVIKIEKILNSAKLSEAYVIEKYRRKGVMTLLFKKCLEWCTEENINEVYLTVVKGNDSAYNFWINLGFYRGELLNNFIVLKKNISEDIVK